MNLYEVYTDLLSEIGDLDPSKALPYDKVKDTTRSVPGTESGGPRFVKGKQEYAFDFIQDQNGYPSKKLMLVKLGYDGDGTMRIDFNPVGTGDIPILGDSYKDLADAKKFFDSLTNDPEVYRAELNKVMGADSSRNVGGASFVGGTEGIERYEHPATKGVSQGGKNSDELTPAELDMRIFSNSRLGTTAAKGFTSKDGSYKYLEEGVDDGMMQDIINDPNKRVKDLVDWFNQSEPMFEKDFDAFMYGRYEKFLNNKDVETKAKMYKVLQKMANK